MDKREIERHNSRLKELTGKFRSSGESEVPKDFLCPILRVEESTLLCKGHIVPKAVQGRTWVVQRKDVDNFYGSFAEAGFIHGVKLRAMPTFEDGVKYVFKHGLARRANVSIYDGDGAKASVHPTRKWAGGQEVLVRPIDGPIDVDRGLSLSINLDVGYETLLTCLHTAHLGIFEGAGYAYVSSSSGQFVANLLRDVYLHFSRLRGAKGCKFDRAHLAAMCQAYTNMVRPLNSVDEFNKRLREDPFRSFILCWCGDTVFAAVHLLQADSEWNAVMVYADLDKRAIAMMVSKEAVSFKATLGRIDNGAIWTDPLRDDSSRIVWPCGENSDVSKAVTIEEVVEHLPPWPSQ